MCMPLNLTRMCMHHGVRFIYIACPECKLFLQVILPNLLSFYLQDFNSAYSGGCVAFQPWRVQGSNELASGFLAYASGSALSSLCTLLLCTSMIDPVGTMYHFPWLIVLSHGSFLRSSSI